MLYVICTQQRYIHICFQLDFALSIVFKTCMLRNGGRWQNVTSNLFVPCIRLEAVFIFFCCFVVISFLVWEERVSQFSPGCLEFCCLPGWPQTQRSVSLCLPHSGTKDLHHHICFDFNSFKNYCLFP